MFQNTAEIIDAALFDGGERTDGTSSFNSQMPRYVNEVYQEIILGGGLFGPKIAQDWFWLIKNASFTLESFIDSGTVTLTKDSTSITFSIAPQVSVVGWYLKISGFEDVFKIASHTAGSNSATLDVSFTGSSRTSSYELMKLEYDISLFASDFIRLMEPMRINYFSGVITGIDLKEMHAINLVINEVPTHFAMIDRTNVRFNGRGFRDRKIRVDFQYIHKPPDLTDSTNSVPLIPEIHRSILADGATYKLLLAKNDDRMQVYLESARNRLSMMIEENRQMMNKIGENFRPIIRRSGYGFNQSESGVIFKWQ